MAYCGGLDWGSAEHGICIIEHDSGKIIARFPVPNDAAGIADLMRRLARLAPPADLPIAIERPSGLIVDALVAADHPVVPIHPNVVKASRPRYRAAGGKSDRSDPYLLADLLRTDGHRFRRLMPCSDEIKALRALVRGRDALVAQRLVLANQLRALLDSFWPGAVAIFADIDSPIALAFVQRYPTPDSAARLGEKRIKAFMAQHRYCGRRSASELWRACGAHRRVWPATAKPMPRVNSCAPGPPSSPVLVAQIAELASRIEHTIGELPDGKIVTSFPRAGRICAAQILAELGDVRERFQAEDQLAAEAGVCPVTHQSGKSRGVVFRWACNHRLRAAITCFADNSRHSSPWAADIYQRAKGRGCDHPHAIRILARAWVRVLWRAWQDRTLYDPARHRSSRASAA
jgi:transposase